MIPTKNEISAYKMLENYTIEQLQEEIDRRLLGKYKSYMDAYNEFSLRVIGVGAKIDGAQGKALKEIIKYLEAEARKKNHEGITAFKFILENWDLLDKYLKGQVKLTQINSNLPNIIISLKNAAGNTKAGQLAELHTRRNRSRT